MIIFSVVKEPFGWAIRMGERMTTPFWSKDLAICEANALADAIRRHGERATVIVEGANLDDQSKPIKRSNITRLHPVSRRRWTGPQ